MVDGTSTANPLNLPKDIPAGDVVKSQAQKNCEAKGGTWDSAARTCILPDDLINQTGGFRGTPSGTTSAAEELKLFGTAAQQEQDIREKPKFGVINDAETGRLTGFQRGDRTLLGLPAREVTDFATSEAELQELPVRGQAEGVLSSQQQRLQAEGFDLSAQVGNDPLSQLQNTFSAQDVDYLAALASGVPGLLPDILRGVAAGAGAGAVGGVSIVPAATVGGIINGVVGFYGDFVADVSRQKGELIETPIRTLTETKSIMNDIIGAQNANPADASNNLEAFNSQLQLLDNEYDRLKDLTDDQLNKFLGENGINQMQEFEVYYVRGGERDQQISEMRIALANPDPARVKPTTVTLEKINERIEEELRKVGITGVV